MAGFRYCFVAVAVLSQVVSRVEAAMQYILPVGDEGGCEEDGKFYGLGSSMPAVEECQTCHCGEVIKETHNLFILIQSRQFFVTVLVNIYLSI